MKSVFITGGSGSLGNALVKILNDLPSVERIVVYSRDEWKQAEMAERFPWYGKVRYMLGDVRDESRLRQCMGGCDVVIHAAALKRVDAVAYNPTEVIKTNVDGTMNVINAACGIAKKVLVVSSDKAVQPTNIYGASKMMAEHFSVYANSFTYARGTAVSCTRYGNVLGSRGSMVLSFKKALAEGKKIRVTDVRCTRFLMTLESAAYFVLASVGMMEGGEIFVPKLRSIRVVDMVAAMTDDDFEVVGMRPGGEKLDETLVSSEEAPRTIDLSDLRYVIYPHMRPWREVESAVKSNFARVDFNSRENEFMTVSEIRELLVKEGFADAD